MNYKVGDFVKVRSDLSITDMNVVSRMLDFRGKIVRIEKVLKNGKNGCYRIKGDYEEWVWTDKMLEPLTEEDIKEYLEECVKDFKDYDIKVEIKKKEPILDEKEKEYLSAVIKPFRNRFKYIEKYNSVDNKSYIIIYIVRFDKTEIERIFLPYFITNTMYKGMVPYKHYTLEELGI